jgi:hypothetical protein
MNPVDEARLREIIEEEIARYLSDLSAEPPASLPARQAGASPPLRAGLKNELSILVLFDGAHSPPVCQEGALDEVFTQLHALSRLYRLIGLAAEDFSTAYPPDFLHQRCTIEMLPADIGSGELETAIAQSELLLAPVLTHTTLVKVALGLGDSLWSCALLRALLMEKKVIAISDFAFAEIEQSAALIVKPAPTSLSNLMHQYRERLRQWGMEFIAPCDIFRCVEEAIVGARSDRSESTSSRPQRPKARQIVTVEDLQRTKQFGQKAFHVERDAIVTDEAKDYAAREGISLEYD